jgi:tetratricopeptide (TPR) repeat protein
MAIQINRSLLLLLSAVFCLLLAPAGALADIQTFTSTVRHAFGDSQSSEDARVVATAKARQDVLKKAGAYVKNLAAVKKQGVAKEAVPALAAGILTIDKAAQKSYAADQAFVFEITVSVRANSATLEAQAESFLKDSNLLKKYQDAHKREADLLAAVTSLEAEGAKLKNATPAEKQAIKAKTEKIVRKLSAVAWYTRALDLANHQTLAGKIPDEAAGYLTKAITLDPEYGDALLWLGRLYSEKSEYGRAADQKALELDVAARGENHPDMAVAYNRLGLARHRNGEHDRAIEAYRKAWKIQIQTLGENHPDVATTYNNMGETYRRKGEYDRAIEYYIKDLEITLPAKGRNHPDLVTTYNNLGYAYHGKGDNDRALEYFRKALDVCRVALGEDHPQTKAIMDNISFLKNNAPAPGQE